MSTREHYSTNLTDEQWLILAPLLPKTKKQPDGPGRPPSDLRTVVDGILHLVKTGCQWRLLPKTFGAWKTLYHYFNTWSKQGVWKRVLKALRHMERSRVGRIKEPSAGCIDSQSVKTVMHGVSRGYDGGKKTKGRKRHILVDTLGLLVAVVVTAANVSDREGLMLLLKDYFSNGVKRLRKIWVDGGYSGNPLWEWVRGLKKTHKIDLEVSSKVSPGFQVIAKRWVVERTFGWMNHRRRLSKDYEVLPRNSEAMIQIGFSTLLLRRLG